jgi:4-amino-4-deoxy-L-arabinose transferase-like glycosyltransferase
MRRLLICRNLLWIILLAFAMRIAVRWYAGAEDFWTNGYTLFFDLAQNLASGSGLKFDGHASAVRVPLYPFFLVAVTFGHKVFFPVLLAQSLIGTGTVVCTALIAGEIFGSVAVLPAAAITAIYPYYVVHDTALQETSLFTFLTALGVFLLLRARRSGSGAVAASAGLTLGAAVLTRATLAPFAAFAPLWLALPSRSGAGLRRLRFRGALLCAGVLALTVSPWLVRSYRLTGTATLTTNAGYLLWVGNNPYTFKFYPSGSIDSSHRVARAALSSQENGEIESRQYNEALKDEWFLQKGLEYVREHPWLSFGNGFRKLGAAFGWLPSPRKGFWTNLVHALAYGFVMTLGLWSMWVGRGNWREHLIFYALFVSFAAVTAVFYGHTSHRSYLDLYWIAFAAGALVRLRTKYFSPVAPADKNVQIANASSDDAWKASCGT